MPLATSGGAPANPSERSGDRGHAGDRRPDGLHAGLESTRAELPHDLLEVRGVVLRLGAHRLDLGAAGIIVPQINTAEQAADVVRFARYSPEGGRGVGLARAHGYGFRFADYVARANAEISVIVQAEHRSAVDNIDSIVSVPGVDAVLLGPYDLSASYGKMGQISDPEVLMGIDRVTQTCQAVQMPLGYFGISFDAVKPWMDQGYTLIVAGVDVLFLGNGARRMLKDLQGN